jgi:indole-3-glycerol phosphate synthase
VLDDLLAGALADAEVRRATRPLSEVESLALARPAAIDAIEALAPSDHVKIIAEVKRASPSRGGPLADIPDPAALAVSYETRRCERDQRADRGQRRFGGSLADLESVRASVSVPVLRKDFIGDPYQVFEARAAGADLVLLIVAALDQPRLSGAVLTHHPSSA